jgi:cell division protein FtsQ
MTPRRPESGRLVDPVRDATVEIRRRRRRQRHRRLRLGLTLGGLTVVAATLTWVIGFSPVFAASDVVVVGVEQSTADEIQAAAEVPLGRPLVRVDTQAIVERVAALPLIAEAQVSRHASGTVEIQVIERHAVYGQVEGAGQVRLVDGSGRAYLEVAVLPGGLLPVTLTQPTDRVRADVATIVEALPAGLRPQVTGLHATSVDHIELSLASGATLFWGSADQSPLKGEVATALVAGVAASYYDVSAPSHPATR